MVDTVLNRPAAIHVLLSQLKNRISPEQFATYLNQLPTGFQAEVSKSRNWQVAQSRVVGRLLLHLGLTKYYQLKSTVLNDIRYTQYNRPHIPGAGIDFNLSHSGSYVACCITDHACVGVDIEQVKPIDVAEFEDQLTKYEWTDVRTSRNQPLKFYSYWTKKEAVTKAEGFGLGVVPLQQIAIDESEDHALLFSKRWFLHKLPLDKDYCGCLATDKPVAKNQIAYEIITFEGPVKNDTL